MMRADLIHSKHNNFHQTQQIDSLELRLKQQVQAKLKQKIQRFSEKEKRVQKHGQKQYFGENDKKGVYKIGSTFQGFLINQSQEAPDGTSQNLLGNKRIKKVIQKYKRFLTQFYETLELLDLNHHDSLVFDQESELVDTFQLLLNIISNTNMNEWMSQESLKKISLEFTIVNQKLQIIDQKFKNRSKNRVLNQNLFISHKINRKIHQQIKGILKDLRTVTELIQLSQLTFSEIADSKTIEEYQNRQAKLNLIALITGFIEDEKIKKQTCLICENGILSYKMESHIVLCKNLYSSIEKIEEINSQIEAKLHDLNSLYISIKKLSLQKRKNSSFDSKESEKKISKFNKKYSRSLYVNRNKSQFLDIFERKPSDQFEDEIPVYKSSQNISFQELEENDIQRYLEIIQDTKMIALKVKNTKREVINPSISLQIKQFKKEIFEKFGTMPSEQILDIISIIKKKLKIIYQIKQLQNKISYQTGHKKSYQFQGEYEDLENLKSESKVHETLTNSAHSDDQRSSSSSKHKLNEVSLKNFKIIKLLSQGKFGEVYLVKKIRTGVKYAMKRILLNNKTNKTQFQNLINQNNAFSSVNNDFLVKAIFSFTEGKYHYFVMEYAPHGDFAKRLMIQQRLYEHQARPLLAQVAIAINSLHQLGIIHRDIKPHNIVIDSEGHLKLTDYGLSQTHQLKKKKLQTKTKTYSKFIYEQLVKKSIKSSKSIKSEKIVGSPYYMAPEVIEYRQITKMSDWWSFGILVYQTLVGQPPFIGEDMDQIASKICEGNIWWTSEILFGDEDNMLSYDAKDLIQSLLMKDQNKRLGHCFQDIKSHNFFYGVNWNQLRQTESPIEVYEEDIEMEEKACNKAQQQFSYYGSTAPGLNLIRRDILSRETKINYYKHLGSIIRLQKILDELIESTRTD